MDDSVSIFYSILHYYVRIKMKNQFYMGIFVSLIFLSKFHKELVRLKVGKYFFIHNLTVFSFKYTLCYSNFLKFIFIIRLNLLRYTYTGPEMWTFSF
jgi:hypothetical protein